MWRIVNGCPTVSVTADAALAVGIFAFCSVWLFMYIDFCDAVRGASRIQRRVNAAEARAAVELLDDEDDESVPAADKYRALRLKLKTLKSVVESKAHLDPQVRHFSDPVLVGPPSPTEDLSKHEMDSDSSSENKTRPRVYSTWVQSTKELMQTGVQLHVRHIGADGWDGTVDGRGTYENEKSITELFSPFGEVMGVAIRHRVSITAGENTSWCLVTMASLEGAQAALSAPRIMAGARELAVNRFDKKVAMVSRGAMKEVSMQAAAITAMRDTKGQMSTKEADRALLKAKWQVLRETISELIENKCHHRMGDGGAALVKAEEDVLRRAFKQADTENDGSLEPFEWASLLQDMLGLDILDPNIEDMSRKALAHDYDGNGELTAKEFLEFWKAQTRGAPGRGAFCSLSFCGGLGLNRQKIRGRNLKVLKAQMWIDVALGVVLLIGATLLSAGVIEMIVADVLYDGLNADCENCTFAEPTHFLLHHEDGCVSHTTYAVHITLTAVVLLPALFIAALLWPLWLLSLQLGVVFASQDVHALLRELRPHNLRLWQEESHNARLATGPISAGEVMFQTQISLPATMLVSTMEQLSTWGRSLGVTIIGCCLFTVGLIPWAVHYGWHAAVTMVLVAVATLPVLVALEPAYVSTNCILLQAQLNDISCVAPTHSPCTT